jgi:hypothetical protein
MAASSFGSEAGANCASAMVTQAPPIAKAMTEAATNERPGGVRRFMSAAALGVGETVREPLGCGHAR